MCLLRPCSLALAVALVGSVGVAQTQDLTPASWPTHGGNAQHTAIAGNRAQTLKRIVWSTPLDLDPQYAGDDLDAHYGSPVISEDNTVVIPVKTGATDGFRIEAHNGQTGALLWQEETDYVVPSHRWFPPLGPTLTSGAAAWARKAGLIGFRDLTGEPNGPAVACFYGMANYEANPAAYDQAVRISSPLVTGDDGSIYFTYRVTGETPMGLKSGIAVVRRNGTSTFIPGAEASANAEFDLPQLNAAPALYKGVVYTVFRKTGSRSGVLVGLDSETLRPIYETPLLDPRSGEPSYLEDDSTSCPTIGPDGDVYFGVIESPFGSHHYRGWLLHFDRTLAISKTPGSFGWDDTASIVPSSMVPSYKGTSSYLVMTKYNNYAGKGDGVNNIAVLDPNAAGVDAFSGVQTMKEIVLKAGPTPDSDLRYYYHRAVREWCINTAAVDVASKSILVNNEDGIVYRWNLETNKLDQKVKISNGLGQAYTPTVVGPTGLVFAISNARLFAIGQ